MVFIKYGQATSFIDLTQHIFILYTYIYIGKFLYKYPLNIYIKVLIKYRQATYFTDTPQHISILYIYYLYGCTQISL